MDLLVSSSHKQGAAPPVYTVPGITVSETRYSLSSATKTYIHVHECEINGQPVMMNASTGAIFITGLLKAAGRRKTDLAKLLALPQAKEAKSVRVRGGVTKVQGTWLEYHAARWMATYVGWNIREQLVPFFGPDFPQDCKTECPPFPRKPLGRPRGAKTKCKLMEHERRASDSSVSSASSTSSCSSSASSSEPSSPSSDHWDSSSMDCDLVSIAGPPTATSACPQFAVPASTVMRPTGQQACLNHINSFLDPSKCHQPWLTALDLTLNPLSLKAGPQYTGSPFQVPSSLSIAPCTSHHGGWSSSPACSSLFPSSFGPMSRKDVDFDLLSLLSGPMETPRATKPGRIASTISPSSLYQSSCSSSSLLPLPLSSSSTSSSSASLVPSHGALPSTVESLSLLDSGSSYGSYFDLFSMSDPPSMSTSTGFGSNMVYNDRDPLNMMLHMPVSPVNLQ